VHLGLCDILKNLRVDLALEKPAAATLLARALRLGDTPDLGRRSGNARGRAIFFAAFVVPSRSLPHDRMLFAGKGPLGCARGKSYSADSQDHH